LKLARLELAEALWETAALVARERSFAQERMTTKKAEAPRQRAPVLEQ